jgi:hypothetical protein
MLKSFFQYLKENSIIHEFRPRTNEIIIERKFIDFELRRAGIDSGLNIFECDNLIVFYYET